MRLNHSPDIRSGIALLLLGCVSVVLYRAGVAASGVSGIRFFMTVAFIQSAIYLLAAWIVIRTRPSTSTLLIVIVLAVIFRLSIVFAPPYLSDDIYRYVWDGRVQAAGINPYRYIPAAPELAHLRDDAIYPRINRRDWAHTIYPPVAQVVFFLTTRISESVVWMKLTMLGFELVTIWAVAQLLTLLGRPRQLLLMYAWHPLVVWEFAGSGHLDAIAICFIALAFLAWQRKSNPGAGFLLACATLVKLFPVVLVPAMLKRGRWGITLVFVATIIAGYLAYLSVGPAAVMGSIPGYTQEMGLISGQQFYALSLVRKLFGLELPALAYVIVTVCVMAAIAVRVLLQKDGSEATLQHAMVLATATTVLFAPHFSWYFCWLVFFLCFTPRLALFYLTIASFLLYATWLGDSPAEMFVINSLIYLPALLIEIAEFSLRRYSLRNAVDGSIFVARQAGR
ncbi:MAG TPA: glycosyltransferase family 87 protein [Pyrinomonadaceae bacterium]|nr:glycosyltransferase family 87 protein [Pyrinomonadaceae bacterium]